MLGIYRIFHPFNYRRTHMRNNFSKIALTAGFSLALAFTFGCAGSKPPAAEDDFADVSNVADDLLRTCIKDYPDHFCGVGEGVSDKAGSAGDIAQARARAEITNQMKLDVRNRLSTGGSVDPNDHDVTSTLNGIFQKAQNIMANTIARDSKTQFNKKEGKYRVYRLVSVPKSDAFKFVKNAISSDETLMSTATAAAVLSIINNDLDKLEK